MGLFSGVSKAVKSVTSSIGKGVSSIASSAKDILGSKLGGTGLEALGTYFGYPGLGTAVSSMFGGGAGGEVNWSDALGSIGSSALSGYMTQQQRKQEQENYDRQYERIRADTIQGIELQNTTAQHIADKANAMSQANAREQMAFQQRSLDQQMAFQERMAGTQHQREVADLRAAGLNPILSGTGGMGAAAPSGGSASGAQGSVTAAPVRGTSDAIATAFEAMKSMAGAFEMKARTDYVKGAQTALTKAQTSGQYSAQDLQKVQIEHENYKVQKTQEEIDKVIQERRNLGSVGKQIVQVTENLEVINDNLKKQGHLTEAQTRQYNQNAANLGEIFKTLHLEGKISDSTYGTAMGYVKRGTDAIGPLLEILNKARRITK